MPKVRRERTLTKRHGSAVSFEPKSKDANEWKQAETKKTKGKKSQGADMIPVDDEDLVGLDVESGANESEESKRASIAEALKDLIAMGDDDDDDDDEEDDDDDDMSDYMKMMKPAKGTLSNRLNPQLTPLLPKLSPLPPHPPLPPLPSPLLHPRHLALSPHVRSKL